MRQSLMVQCSLRNDVLPATINRHPKEKAPVPFGQGLSLYLCSKFYILYRIHHIYTILSPMAKTLSHKVTIYIDGKIAEAFH